ncbi:hypothetical protein FH972_002615 [Carpinus fangiana]|uniref:Uncharacterized protein n=1 Tax=Carpinus fangiana TaxID=176857 RepID=A0A5N6QFF0_9ROSI|nr:hypothetical protein FH972_002615 [Carpinus fangiana]
MSTIFTHLCQLFQKFLPQPVPVPVPPQVDVEAGAQPLDLEVLHNNMVNFCLASATAIALTYAQIHSNYSPTFHVLSFEIILCFASFFVSKFMKPKFPAIAPVLEGVGVFFAVTAFFTAITIPFPLCLQIITWLLYAISFLVILVSTLF